MAFSETRVHVSLALSQSYTGNVSIGIFGRSNTIPNHGRLGYRNSQTCKTSLRQYQRTTLCIGSVFSNFGAYISRYIKCMITFVTTIHLIETFIYTET